MSKRITKQQLKNNFIKSDIVIVSGSFDLLHTGHRHFFKQAKGLVGDDGALVVIVLSDEQIKRRKGQDRPIHNIGERVSALSETNLVDYVLVWDEPWESLREFLPNINVKYLASNDGDPGLDNKKKIAKANDIEFKVFKRLDGYSTTEKIKKLTECHCGPDESMVL